MGQMRGHPAVFVSSCRRARSQSIQWESNPHVRVGNAAGGRYIMDAWGAVRVEVAGKTGIAPEFQVPNLTRDYPQFVSRLRWARLPVPMAGVEPAAFSL